MKNIKMIVMAFLVVIMCVNLASCSNETPFLDEQLETCTVQLGWTGEWSVSYEPLSRTTNDDLYGIQVYSTPNKDGQSGGWTGYAYGLFDNPNNISVQLIKGYKYKFVATIVKNAKNKIYSFEENKFMLPFSYGNKQGDITYADALLCDNKFTYSTLTFYGELQNGESQLADGNTYNRPNTDRFYGEFTDFVPNEDADVSIPMKRVSFGASFVAINSIEKTGKVSIEMENAPKMEIPFTASELDQFWVKDILTFSNVKAAYDSEDYSETISVTIKWIREDQTEIPLGTHSIVYKRNKNNIVTIKISNAASDKQVSFSIADEETKDIETMVEGEKTTIEDGEIVDTNVGTNP